MFWPWQKRLSIKDLENKFSNIKIDTPQIDLRRKIKILVIDDKDFTPKENLHQIGYNIVHVNDIDRIKDVIDYDLILVDLKGVGMKLNPENQGAFLIKEIKTNYPGKIVIAYTGGAMDELMAMAVNYADKYLQKDSGIEDWCNLLDDSIKDLAHPIEVWKNARKRLLDCGFSPKELMDIEHCYVEGFDNGEVNLESLIRKADKMNISSDAKTIIYGIASNAAFSLIKASIGLP